MSKSKFLGVNALRIEVLDAVVTLIKGHRGKSKSSAWNGIEHAKMQLIFKIVHRPIFIYLF